MFLPDCRSLVVLVCDCGTTSSATIVVGVLFINGVSVPFLPVLASPLALCGVLYVLA